MVPRRSDFGEGEVPFQLEGFFYEDDEMSPIDIEVREPRTGEIVQLKVIGVLDQFTDSFGEIGFGMFASKANLDDAIPFPVPITTYRFPIGGGRGPWTGCPGPGGLLPGERHGDRGAGRVGGGAGGG